MSADFRQCVHADIPRRVRNGNWKIQLQTYHQQLSPQQEKRAPKEMAYSQDERLRSYRR